MKVVTERGGNWKEWKKTLNKVNQLLGEIKRQNVFRKE